MSVDKFREAARVFVTNVAIITSNGPYGQNAMSAEWTFQISYRPMRLITLIHPDDATFNNVSATKEFGANFLADDQALLANLGGAYTGKEVNKLSSHSFKTYPAKVIRAPMVSGCFVNAECRVSDVLETGDHAMFVGDVAEISHDPTKKPLLYSQRSYWSIGETVKKTPDIYVTSTARSTSVRVEGRLLGLESYPQEVELTISDESVGSQNEQPVASKTVATDIYGYFELTEEFTSSSRKEGDSIIVRATWRGLTANAETRWISGLNRSEP